jgi:hypothetical protein
MTGHDNASFFGLKMIRRLMIFSCSLLLILFVSFVMYELGYNHLNFDVRLICFDLIN